MHYLDSVVVDDFEWFVVDEIKSLCRRCCKTRKIEVVELLDENASIDLYSRMLYVDGYIVGVPFQANSLFSYNIKERQMKKIKSFDGYSFFSSALIIDDLIYMIPCRYSKILILNVVTDEITEIDIINSLKLDADKLLFLEGVASIHNKIVLASMQTTDVWSLDLQSYEVTKILEKIVPGNGITHIAIHSNKIVVVGDCGDVTLFDQKTNENRTIQLENNDINGWAFNSCLLIDECLYLLGGTSKKVYKVNLNTMEIKKRQIVEFGGNKTDYWHDFLWIKEFDDRTLIIKETKDGIINSYSKDTLEEIESLGQEELDNDSFANAMKHCKNMYFSEDRFINISIFVKSIIGE